MHIIYIHCILKYIDGSERCLVYRQQETEVVAGSCEKTAVALSLATDPLRNFLSHIFLTPTYFGTCNACVNYSRNL